MIEDLLHSELNFREFYATEEWIYSNKALFNLVEVYFTNKEEPVFGKAKVNQENIKQIPSKEMERISAFKTPPGVLAVVEIPRNKSIGEEIKNELVLCLDEIQDPGNVGTIFRIADWFNIRIVICSPGCADAYQPKVVQASMGSIFRLFPITMSLIDFLKENNKINSGEVYGSFVHSENIYTSELKKDGVIIIGNESKGISEELIPYITKKISIPSYSSGNTSPESLNAAVATGIICSEFRRRGQGSGVRDKK